MYLYLHQYFATNKRLSLPGIGTFETSYTPADLDFVNRSLKAPVFNIIFHAEEKITDDNLVAFLAMRTGNSVEDCAAAFNDFSNAMQQKLKAGETENLPGIGSIKLEQKHYVFTPDNAVQQFFPAVTAEKIVRPNASHTVKVGEEEKTSEQMHELLNTAVKKDPWMLAATLLAAAGIIAIAAYYLTK
ncbi:MAG TPA: HU family DNA-binding protein [Panacibacter sp.]|nr:HU family DNA-binding protein [Panacibacter sp.]HNP46222.1 HU family DNA-binding protein [Panacibacter sp.]